MEINNNRRTSPGYHPARHGNALVVALGILTIVTAAVTVSTIRGTAVYKESQILRFDAITAGAVDAVIARQELAVIRLAEAGDPTAFALIDQNYGSEIFGQCEVRWKMEPVRTAHKDAAGDPLPFITNPSPDIGWPTPTAGIKDAAGRNYPDPGGAANQPASDAADVPYWRPNDNTYLFRIAAEARYVEIGPEAQLAFGARDNDNLDWGWPGTFKARAQGVRYIAVSREPLFRYVIFYGQEGPKGDLELSHGPAINLQGNVHSNGSVYMGASTEVNNWNAARPNNGDSQIGPDPWSATTTYSVGARVSVTVATLTKYFQYINNTATSNKDPTDPANIDTYWRSLKDGRVRVTGVDGLFRLAKPLMYGRFNGFPMLAPTNMPSWTPPAGNPAAAEYDIALAGTPLDGYDGSAGTILARTFSGGWVNPYRLGRDSLLITRSLDGDDDARRINGQSLIGWGATADDANDSRDAERGATRKWSSLSVAAPPDGFGGFARSRATGGALKSLPQSLSGDNPIDLRNRPLEAQKPFYPDLYVKDLIRRFRPISAPDILSPAINPFLGGLTASTVPSNTTPALQPFLTASRERGDDHSRATPLFWNGASESHIPVNDMEVPGQYIRYVIDGRGGGNFLKRQVDPLQGFIGWSVVDGSGAAVGMSDQVGLMIRERPVPDFNYWGVRPDGVYFNDRPYGDANYLPYAYGKHKDTTVWPFTELYVSGRNTATRPGSSAPTANAELPANDPNYATLVTAYNGNRMHLGGSTQSYIIDPDNPGRIRITAAAKRGSDGYDPVNWGGVTANYDVPTDNNGFFRDNWRMIHLKRSNVVAPVGPRLDMTQASTYFGAATFQAVQGRFLPKIDTTVTPSTSTLIVGGSNNQQLAGLMIRPVDRAAAGVGADINLGSTALNGRDPYVALLVSPQRGIVVQRKMEPSRLRWVVVPTYRRYFTATDDASGSESANLGCINAPEEEVLSQTNRQPSTSGTYGAAQTWESGIVRTPATGYNNWYEVDGASSFSRTLVKAQGEGSVSQTFTFERGPYTRRKRWQANKYWSVYRYRPRLTEGQYGYIDLEITGAGAGGEVTFQTSMTTAPNNATWANGWSGRRIWLDPTWGSGAASDPTAWLGRHTLEGLINPAGTNPGRGFQAADRYRVRYNPGTNDNTLTSGTNTNYSPTPVNLTTEWVSTGTSANVFSDRAGYAAAVTWMGSAAAVNAALGLTPTTLGAIGTPATPTAEPGDPTRPANPADPNPGAPPTVPDYSGSNPMRFAILRDSLGNYSRPIEYNSFISARGRWFDPATDRFQNTTANTNDVISGTPADHLYDPALTPGTSSSLRPDYWSGAAKATPSWTDMYDPTDVVDGSIVPNTTGYLIDARLNSSAGDVNLRLWEDAQVPYWTAGPNFVAETALVPASVVLYNNLFWECTTNHTSAWALSPGQAGAPWARADHIHLRIEKVASELVFKYFVSTTPPTGLADIRWHEVTEARQRRPDGLADLPDPVNNPSSRIAIPASWTNDWMVGPALQSGHQTTTATVEFSNLTVYDSADTGTISPGRWDHEDWERGVETVRNAVASPVILAAAYRTVDNVTKYLCSQYQVFWGPQDITEDFFSYSTDRTGATDKRLATETWFYNPREFWSQSAWWNEGDVGSAFTPIPRADWVYKETGTTTAPATLPSSNSTSSWVEYASRVTVLDVNLGNLQTYIRSRSLTDATYRWSTAASGISAPDILATRFSGTIYAARTNRYPRNPMPSQENPWNPDLPNTELNTGPTRPVELYDMAVDKWSDPEEVTEPTRKTTRERLIPLDASTRAPLSPPLRPSDFIHGIMLSNAKTVNWGYPTSGEKIFGSSNMSFVTPNALYVRGDLNDQKTTVKLKPAAALTYDKYAGVAVMGDSVTLLSNSWNQANYQRPGLTVNSGKVASWGGTTLSQLNGTTAAAVTSYRTCILTNNQPTTKQRVFNGEGAPFINTMMYIENWDAKTMNFTGSLVVLDSCRYTSAFLLQDARTYGRSPFGLMGWHCDNWSTLTGWSGGFADWCKDAGNNRLPYAGDANSTTDPYGAPQVYKPPTRNMSFNDDLLSEQGTPPNTPFGVTAAGVAGWTRVIR